MDRHKADSRLQAVLSFYFEVNSYLKIAQLFDCLLYTSRCV